MSGTLDWWCSDVSSVFRPAKVVSERAEWTSGLAVEKFVRRRNRAEDCQLHRDYIFAV